MLRAEPNKAANASSVGWVTASVLFGPTKRLRVRAARISSGMTAPSDSTSTTQFARSTSIPSCLERSSSSTCFPNQASIDLKYSRRVPTKPSEGTDTQSTSSRTRLTGSGGSTITPGGGHGPGRVYRQSGYTICVIRSVIDSARQASASRTDRISWDIDQGGSRLTTARRIFRACWTR